MYALVEYKGKQIILEEKTKIKVPYTNQKIGSKILFENVLLFDDGKKQLIGNPLVKNLSFSGKLFANEKEKKVIVFKFKRRKGYQKKAGHRQRYSIVEVSKLTSSTASKKDTKKAVAPKKTTAKTSTKKAATPKKTTAKASMKKAATPKKTATKASTNKNKE